MFWRLLLLFTVLPVAELALLIKVGRAINVGPTIGLVILTGLVGAALARHQGLRTLRRIHQDTARGVMPATELLNGVMILAAGLLLVTPGIITDAIGFLLLIPPARNRLRTRLANYVKKRLVITCEPTGHSQPGGEDIIDVEGHVVSEEGPGEEHDRCT